MSKFAFDCTTLYFEMRKKSESLQLALFAHLEELQKVFKKGNIQFGSKFSIEISMAFDCFFSCLHHIFLPIRISLQ